MYRKPTRKEGIPMKFFQYHSAVALLEEVESFLVENEAKHNLPLGVLKHLAKQEKRTVPSLHQKELLMALGVTEDNKPAIVLLRTFPRNLIVCGHKSAVSEAAEWLYNEAGPTIPGVIGCLEVATAFSEEWKQHTSCQVEKVMKQKIYQLEQLKDHSRNKGKLSYANEDDIALVMSWTEDFERETLGKAENQELENNVKKEIQNNQVFLWRNENCMPVSMAKRARELQNGVVVNFVYTPEEYQGQGYATSCVAALSERMLQEGFQFCTLNTNADNPTSNAVYMRIGYEVIGDAMEYRFDYK